MDMASKDNHKDTDNKLKLNGHNKNEDIPLKDVIGDNDVSLDYCLYTTYFVYFIRV